MKTRWIDDVFPEKENKHGSLADLKAASFNSADRTFDGILTKENEDRDGDVLEKGVFDNEFLKDFRNRPVMLWSHKSAEPPIGEWTDIDASKDPVPVTGRLRPAGDDAMADNAASAIKFGFGLLAISAGFRTLEATRGMDSDGFPSGPRRVQKAALWEGSLVTIPSNVAGAIKTVKALVGDAFAQGAETSDLFIQVTDLEVLERAGVLVKRIALALASSDRVPDANVKAANELRIAIAATASGEEDLKAGAREIVNLASFLTQKAAAFTKKQE